MLRRGVVHGQHRASLPFYDLVMEHVEGVTSEKRAGDFNKPNTLKDYAFKSFTVDIDGVGKSERPEWGEGKYQGKYRPDKAFS